MKTRMSLLAMAFAVASCSSINLKAVEDPETPQSSSPTTAEGPEVLGTAVTAAPTTTEAASTDDASVEENPILAEDQPQSTVAVAVPDSGPVDADQTTATDNAQSESDTTVSTSVDEPEPEPEPAPRIVVHNNFDAFATVGGFTLFLPAREVELIGFHESNHDGAQQVEPLEIVVPMTTMESRDRGNGSRTAIDVAVNPASEIRSPVTGTVVRAGTYTLYCQHSDDYAVIAPDEQPTWEVKLLHINGVQVKAGDRVIAQETVIAPAPTPLPFRSQIDKLTVAPAPPHVHIEVVDPSIPDRPSGGC